MASPQFQQVIDQIKALAGKASDASIEKLRGINERMARAAETHDCLPIAGRPAMTRLLPGTENDDDAVTPDEDEDGGIGRHLDGVIATVTALWAW
ncbi:MAG TPA: hypothetical protein VF926_07855 [Mycobacterium sp.]